MENKIFCIHDSDPQLKKRGAFEIGISEAEMYNLLGYGIFYTVNDFEGARKVENLTKINYWLVDIDEGTKEEQMAKIKNLPIKPTMIIETFAGYHCYWKAEDAKIENYGEVVKGLIKRLDGDTACKDGVRLLRCPHYFHMKNPAEPFKIKIIYKDDRVISEAKMLFAFKLQKPRLKAVNHTFTKTGSDNDWWFDRLERNKRLRVNEIVRGVIDNTMRKYFLWASEEVGTANATKIIAELNQDIAEPMVSSDLNRICRTK